MALGPEKFVKKSIEEDKLMIDKLEKKIDRELENRYFGEEFFVVEVAGVSKSVVDELKKKYLQAGWTNVDYYNIEGRFGELEGGRFRFVAKQVPSNRTFVNKENDDLYPSCDGSSRYRF